MARPRSDKPGYLRDKSTERALVIIDGKRIYLGPPGSYGSRESRDKYDRLIGEWIARGRAPDAAMPLAGTAAVVSVADVCLAFWEHAVRRYPAPSFAAGRRPKGESGNYFDVLRPLRRLFGPTPAAKFGPLALETLRDEMIRLGWCRNVLNRRLKRVQRVFKWAASRQLIPGSVYADLATVEGLRKGHPGVRETPKVGPVSDVQVDAVLPLLSPQVRAMIELQRLTGARSSELCTLRTGDIDTTGKVWVYQPAMHKTAHHDQVRHILIGPKARAILEPLLKPDLQAFVFSPDEAVAWHREQKRAKRRTPLTPSQLARSERARQCPEKGQRRPGKRYTKDSYAEAIERACDIAFPPPVELARSKVKTPRGKRQTRRESVAEWRARLGEQKWAELLKWRKAHRWHPHQLRHSFATRIRKDFGRDVVGAMLGDRSPAMVDVYAERDQEQARKVAAQIG